MERSDKAPAPHAGEAFGKAPPRARWSIGHRIFILALLACLGFVVFGFNTIKQQSCLSAPNSPSLASVPARALLELRANLASVMSGADGQAYASGTVPVQAVWTDNPPEGRSLELSKDGLGPASDEIREWAPDPMWGPAYRDDIAADVFRFAAASQALRFFDEATSCRT
jgi:hypothetical protein